VVGGRAIAVPGSDATSQNALDVAAVESFDDLRTHAKSFSIQKKTLFWERTSPYYGKNTSNKQREMTARHYFKT
jgi:hypothetical protein